MQFTQGLTSCWRQFFIDRFGREHDLPKRGETPPLRLEEVLEAE
ncbi:hypothetical protein [Brachybacterium sp. GPGPB12]